MAYIADVKYIKSIHWIWMMPLALCIPFLPQIPGFFVATATKTGKVMEAITGAPIEGAIVIVTGKVFSNSNSGSNVFRAIATTASDGSFEVRSTKLEALQNFAIRLPGTNSKIEWFVTVFKPGFAFESDTPSWTEVLDSGQPKFWPQSATQTPPHHWDGLTLIVELPPLVPVNLTLRQAAIYERFVVLSGGWSPNPNKDEMEVRKLAGDIFRPKVCELDTSAQMDQFEAYAFQAFVLSPNKFNQELRKLEPPATEEGRWFRATNVCQAMQAGSL